MSGAVGLLIERLPWYGIHAAARRYGRNDSVVCHRLRRSSQIDVYRLDRITVENSNVGSRSSTALN
jgi:hypothetical protein